MEKRTHPFYRDYPEQPYISPQRDLDAWEKTPDRFPYGVVEKRQMQRLAEGILPGHVVMLWRIHFGNFTNESVHPQYFEYRYGVDGAECIETLIRLGYAIKCGAKDSLNLLNLRALKAILLENGLSAKGKKEELLTWIAGHVPEEKLEEAFPLRKYRITPAGESVLEKHGEIIKRHGPKM